MKDGKPSVDFIKNLGFDEIYDIVAFRIILDEISQCYEALGLIHSLWTPIDIKFKDYIGFPKSNMYQSLHTTVMGPTGERIELQIRTHDMDHVAKSGIAAHWSYKEGNPVDESVSEKFAWIQKLVDNQENFSNPSEFMENVRIDLFPDDVYVFTPRGEIKTLPRGATPVDFAYSVHTDVGHTCVACRLDNRFAPLNTPLYSGQTVEIVTSASSRPNPAWLNYVVTAKARANIRNYLKKPYPIIKCI